MKAPTARTSQHESLSGAIDHDELRPVATTSPSVIDLTERPPWLPQPTGRVEVATSSSARKPLTQDTLYCVAMQAGLSAQAGHYLATDTKASDPFALDKLLSYYGKLSFIPNGAQAYAQLIMRPASTFSGEQTAALQNDMTPQASSGVFDKVIWNRQKQQQPAKATLAETKSIADRKAKVSEESHAAAQLRVMVWGHVDDKDALDASLASIITDGFSFYGTGQQKLIWTRCDPRLLLAQLFVDYEPDKLLYLTSSEVTAFAHGADKHMSSNSVDTMRSSLLPLRPDHPYPMVADPLLGAPKGIIPIGVDAKGSEDERVYSLQDKPS